MTNPDDLTAFGHLVDGERKHGRAGTILRSMAETYFRTDWIACPRCQREWMKLYDETQCYDCWHKDDQDAKKQAVLGEYLKKTIGQYGIENYGFHRFRVEEGNRLAFENAQRFDPSRDSLFLYGSCGVGKTHLAGAILKKCAAENISAIWANPIWLSRQFRMRTREEEEALIAEFSRTPVLILDDLGVGKDTEFSLGKLYEIIGNRMKDNRHGLVVTSNLDFDQLAKKFGDDRLTSRLSAYCRVYHVVGDDFRLPRLRQRDPLQGPGLPAGARMWLT